MLNYLWTFLIILSVITSIFTGNVSETVEGALSGAQNAVNMCLSLLGVMCMWNGLIKIAQCSGITEKISKQIRPNFKLIFNGIPANSKSAEYITMNLSANLLGLGNAATPLGISAMKEMKKAGFDSHMIVFTVLNTASFQLIPSTMIAMRSAAGATNPSEILVPVWCASICSVTFAVMCAKLLNKKRFCGNGNTNKYAKIKR